MNNVNNAHYQACSARGVMERPDITTLAVVTIGAEHVEG